MSALEWLGVTLALAGAGLGLIGGIGVLRFPDFFSRLHAAGVTDTLATGLFLAGLACLMAEWQASLKLALIFLFMLFTSPTASHALAKAALHGGLRPWRRGEDGRG
ncbi:MAG: monovalent cation/H(+) antiporter subunit G [Xanthomonadales bacterium]|nr:monovalent cation/H(+) antiporter subunit G [Xanthomonadales bacterium]